MDTGDIIRHYIKWRDKKKEIEERHKEELAPLKDKMEKAEAALQKIMLDQGVKQVKGSAGTAYLTEQVSTKVSDWEETLEWVKNQNRFDVLDRRVNKTAAQEEEIPGVEVSRRIKVNVRIT